MTGKFIKGKWVEQPEPVEVPHGILPYTNYHDLIYYFRESNPNRKIIILCRDCNELDMVKYNICESYRVRLLQDKLQSDIFGEIKLVIVDRDLYCLRGLHNTYVMATGFAYYNLTLHQIAWLNTLRYK